MSSQLPAEYLAMVERLPDMALLYDVAGPLVHSNPAGLAQLRGLSLLPPDRALADVDLVAGVRPHDQPRLRAALREALESRATRPMRLELTAAVPAPFAAVLVNPMTLDGRDYIQVLIRDVTERVSAERAVAASEARLRAIFDHSPVGVAVVEGGRFTVVNPAFCALLARSADELVGLTSDDITHPEDLGLHESVISTLDRGEVAQVVKRYVRPDHSVVYGELVAVRVTVADTKHTVVHLRDITAEREARTNLEHMAMHDTLTGLGNRVLVQDRLDHALARRSGSRPPLAVLFIDLDDFKQINDALSHAVGDKVLETVSRRLRDAVRPGDTLGRWGGDEFVVILEDVHDDAEALAVVERIRRVVAAPIPHRQDELFVTASVGVAFCRGEDTTSATQLLVGADAAMYRAKAQGRNRHSVFDQALRDAAARRGHIDAVLRSALEHDRVVVHYQPLVDLVTRRIVGAEALLRLRDDDGTLLHPDAFLDIAEDLGLMLQVEHEVLRVACEQAARWRDDGHDLSVSVNVCATQLTRIDDLEAAIGRALASSGLAPDRLVCEVTEHGLVETGGRTVAGMQRLRATGVQFAVDDFGTGYASMTYLRHLPVSEVKIDRRFVVEAGTDRRAGAIVRAVAGMARELDMHCVAEGIEDEQTHELALRLGADRGQGYLYARPMPADAFARHLADPPDWAPPADDSDVTRGGPVSR